MKHNFPNRKQSVQVAVLVEHKNKYLLLKKEKKESWEIPRGTVNFAEHPDAAAVRNIFEDTALNISPHFVDFTDAEFRHKHGEHAHYVLLIYTAKAPTNKLTLHDEDLDEHKWVTSAQLEKEDLDSVSQEILKTLKTEGKL